eukprot:11157588-Lingulodinium_polyedra.AAC.1
MGRPAARAAAPVEQAGVARPPGPAPDGCHDPRREGDLLSCVACGRSAQRQRWTALARSSSPLSASSAAAWAWW